ncbi:TonB-dependent siderophore receptor [Pseudomonas sp. TUM22785]|uniref:TonB-dependent siderophore receptor n=1 Tax=Pseudomonas sp. TUM22785 TaxID=3019098 RepID=UPI0023068085|nr:TonB-dependent receptor [Pseudomonas sp. TUM22785]WCD80464.1 TonB-dependent siderophore receptor [Pseudomonas sp. TUM22785]
MPAHPSLLARRIRHAALSLSLSGSLLALPSAWAEPLGYDIPAGSLATALSQFAAASGVTLSFSSEETAGLQSPGLHGDYELEQGFAQLLQGSDLLLRQAGEKRYVLLKAEQDNAMQLDATRISSSTLGQTTEGSGSYTTGAMQSATKLPLSIRETPQSVSVITRQRMDDQGMKTLEDVLKSTPGISMTRNGPQRPNFYARGFAVENLMTDGLSSELSHYLTRDMNSSPDMAIYDRVEVVRGATGMMQGAGNPSAAINLVRKRPTASPYLTITGSAGSWDNYRSEVDASNALNESGTLRGRVVTSYQTKQSFQDVADSERTVFYAIGEADLGDWATLTLGASDQNGNNTSSWGGLPTAKDGSDLHLPRSTYLGNDWEYWDQDNTTLFTRLEQRFDNDWKLLLAASRTWSDLAMHGTQVERIYWVDEDQFGQYVGQYRYKDRQNSYDAYTSGPFQAFGRTHELVVGASQRELIFQGNGNYLDDELDMDIFAWNPSRVPKRNLDMSYWQQERSSRQKGGYITSRLNLRDDLKLIVGGRLDWFDYDATTRNGTRTTHSGYEVTRHVTRYAGVIFDLDAHHSAYASYTDIFKPQSELTASAQGLKPIEGKNHEVGIKGEYFDGRLNASAAIFRIDQENRAQSLDRNQCSDLVPSCYEAAGVVRSEGLELEINGSLAPGWQIGAGYTYAEAKYHKDETNQGRLFDTELPRHMFKAFTSYQLPGELHRWTLGGGVYRQNTVYNQDTNFYGAETPFRIEQKGYTLVDLMTNYKASEQVDLRLNLNNIFDKKYYQSIGSNTAFAVNQYGEPRNATLTLRWSL